MSEPQSDWLIFRGETQEPGEDRIEQLPDPPPWRRLEKPASVYLVGDSTKRMVNAALYLRRPLLVTGDPGTGKSSLARAVADELKLGPVLKWSITTRTSLADGLYSYDAVGRLQDASLERTSNEPIRHQRIGDYIRIGPLGTAFLPQKERPRVLLIDEIDKSDIDLPHDLLHLLEEGGFDLPELQRLPELPPDDPVMVRLHDGERASMGNSGRVQVKPDLFPLIIMTSNRERVFPAPFRRRCLFLELDRPSEGDLVEIVSRHLNLRPGGTSQKELEERKVLDLITQFVEARDKAGYLATDQLLHAIFLLFEGVNIDSIKKDLFHPLKGD